MHRRLSLVLLLAMLASLLPVSAGTVSAATLRTFVAQVPAIAGTGSVRIWMNSDTALGETAGIETLINGVYTKRLGTFDTSYPGANWRVDIPGQAAGTLVQYQLFTRNQSGSDYGFTGFVFSYTASGLACAGGVAGDNNVFFAGLFHDSFSTAYRSPTGPVTSAQGTVTLRTRTCQNDVQNVSVRVWNDRANTQTIAPMVFDGNATDASVGPVSFWRVDLPIPSDPTALYYTFRASDGTASGYYRDDDPKFLGGGFGQAEASQTVAYDNSYQLTVYDPAFATPVWMQSGIMYQIFPDRFRDGNPANNPAAGRFSYGPGVAIVRSNDPEGDWNSAVCDPRAAGPCFGRYGDNFYGGDLQGITQKIEDGYFSNLGVTIIYLNPIFRAPSNHKYDTANFLEIDPDFGTLADFQAMVAAANARGIRIMLDGVFNHTSSDSPYFDRYSRFDAAGNLTAPNGGSNDGSGACEAVSSAYYSWFYFPDIGNAGRDGSTIVTCANGSTYEAWYGYSSLPKIKSGLPQVRSYFYGGPAAVGPYWTAQGASAWRFDVGADVDPGLTNDPSNTYWEEFRTAVRTPALSGKTDTVMLGEEWGDATPWLLGNEWDSVMNYRFRSAVLGWMFTGCGGNGCTGGTRFQENDSNDFSSSGAIFYLSPSQFNARLRSIAEDYPPNAFKAMMNLPGSHDTQRVRFLLKKINNDNDAAAVQRMKEWWIFAFTYAGNPTLYYGDEVGLSHDGVWDGSQFQDDPYNRAPFPWADASGGAYVPDTTNLLPFARHMASIRQSYPALQDGDVQHGLVINDAQQLYGFARTNGQQTALILLNRGGSARSATFSGLNAAPYNLPDGTILLDAISGAGYVVSGGAVTVSVTPTWGAVLLEQNKIQAPAAASLSAAGQGADVVLSWPSVTTDSAGAPEVTTIYTIHRSTSAVFTPGAGNQIASLANPALGGSPSYTDAGAAMGGYSYIVRACNAAGQCSSSPAVAPTRQTATLAASAASGTYGGSVTLQATLTSGGPLAGRTVVFSLNGGSVGSATTNASGTASLTVSLGAIGAGSYPGGVGASFAGDNAYNPAADSAALSVAKATATVTLGGLSATYDGGAQAATASTSPAGLSVDLSYSATPIGAGSYAVTATIVDDNYQGGASGTLVIARAATTTEISCPTSVTYSGAAQTPCTATVTGPGGLSQAVAVSYTSNTNAGTATASASYAGGANHLASSDSESFTIDKAATATTVSCPASVTYSGAAQEPCTAAVTGPGGLSQALTVSYADNTNAGAATASASYPGGANYEASADTAGFTIGQAGTTTTITCPAGVDFTGAAQEPCTATVTGAGGLDESLAVSYADNTDAGTATASASYPGSANYEASSSSTTFTIGAVGSTVTISCPASVTYSGAAQEPCSATVTGVGGLNLALTVTYTNNTDAGTATASASYPGSANHAGSSGSTTFTIDKAGTTTAVSCPASVTYTGAAQTPCTATVTGPGGLSQALTVSYADNTNAGAATASASYPGGANYESSSDSAGFTIDRAASTTTVSCPASVTYSGAAQTPCTATVTGPGGLSQALTVSYANNTNAGAATASASYPGGANYEASDDSAAFTIDKAASTTTVSCPASVTYSGAAQTPCTATVTGPGGLRQALTVSYMDNLNAGTATASASYAGGANHEASGSSATFAIDKASQTISLSGVPASITAGGSFTVSATASSGLPVSLSVGGPCTISGNTVTTTAPGTCTVTASQGGNSNYNAATPVSQSATVSAPPTTYTFTGFFAPVDNPPTINVVKAGQAIPVKFSLGGNFGLNIFAAGSPMVASLVCPASAPTDAIETTVSATANSLSYDPASNQYTFVWKTEKSFAGSCRQLVLKFSDGQVKTATFNFTR